MLQLTNPPSWSLYTSQSGLWWRWCIFLQQYRILMDIGNSKNYLGIKNIINHEILLVKCAIGFQRPFAVRNAQGYPLALHTKLVTWCWALVCPCPVLLFSKLNKIFFGYFDPEMSFTIMKNNNFKGELTDISAKKEVLSMSTCTFFCFRDVMLGGYVHSIAALQ